jgi:dynein intermediate chain 1
LIPHVEQLAVHFQIDGNLILKDSEDAKRQATKAAGDAEKMSRENSQEMEEKQQQQDQAANEAAAAAAKGGDDEDDEEKKVKGSGSGSGKEKKLTNQFNFSERASQSYNNPSRENGTMTEPPPRINFSSNATQWEIFDAYIEDFEQQVK